MPFLEKEDGTDLQDLKETFETSASSFNAMPDWGKFCRKLEFYNELKFANLSKNESMGFALYLSPCLKRQ